jgi:hypothetical protein
LTGKGRYLEIGSEGELLSEFVNRSDDPHVTGRSVPGI